MTNDRMFDAFAFCSVCYSSTFKLRLDYANKKRVPECASCGKELAD